MPFLVAIAVLMIAAPLISISGAEIARPATSLWIAILVLIGLFLPRLRRGMTSAIIRFWPVALAFAAMVGAAGLQAGYLLAPTQAVEPFAARLAVFDIAALGLAWAVTAGAALAYGFRALIRVVLSSGIALGLYGAYAVTRAAAEAWRGPEVAAYFALMLALAAFAFADEVSRHARPTDTAPLPGLPQRAIIPVAAILTSASWLAIASRPEWIVAALLGVALLAALLALRERRGGGPSFRLAAAVCGASALAVAFASGGAGLSPPAGEIMGALAERPLQGAGPLTHSKALSLPGQLLSETGLIGASLALAVVLGLLARLAMTPDRRRQPSRALALAAGSTLAIAVAGMGTNPLSLVAPALLYAVCLGVAATLIDRPSPRLRTPDPR